MLGFTFTEKVVVWLSATLETSGRWMPFAAFMLVFVGTIWAVYALGKLIKKTLSLTPFGTFDNFAGAILGLAKWAFGLSMIIWLLQSFQFTLPEKLVSNSYIFPILEGFAPMVVSMVAKFLPFAGDLFFNIKDMFQEELGHLSR